MEKEIAVFISESGETASMEDSGVVKIFFKDEDKWNVSREKEFFIDHAKGIKGVRSSIDDLIGFLGKCDIFVGGEVTGLLYNILDVHGVSISEMKGKPQEFLDYLLEEDKKYEKLAEVKPEDEVMPYPVRTSAEGYFSINLKLLSINKPNVTSKQALIPFLNNKDFYELEVICSHVPKWLEAELEKLNLKCEMIEESENQHKVIIYHKTCT
ncbi:MAG: Fe-only nitrogenase accessory protein AnfO [Clostridiaceae bacterium]